MDIASYTRLWLSKGAVAGAEDFGVTANHQNLIDETYKFDLELKNKDKRNIGPQGTVKGRGDQQAFSFHSSFHTSKISLCANLANQKLLNVAIDICRLLPERPVAGIDLTPRQTPKPLIHTLTHGRW